MNHTDATNLAYSAGKWIVRKTWPGYKVGLGEMGGVEVLVCRDLVPDQMKWQEVWRPTEEDLAAEDYEVV